MKAIQLNDEQIKNLYEMGFSARQIAAKLKASQSRILKQLRAMGIVRSDSEAKKIGYKAGLLKVTRYWKGKKQPKEAIAKRVAKTSGPNHYLWKGGSDNREYRKMVEKQKCEICGARLNLCIHHKNFDHYNNAETNLQVLCVNCHLSLHKKMYWDAVKAGKIPPKSNAPTGWTRKV